MTEGSPGKGRGLESRGNGRWPQPSVILLGATLSSAWENAGTQKASSHSNLKPSKNHKLGNSLILWIHACHSHSTGREPWAELKHARTVPSFGHRGASSGDKTTSVLKASLPLFTRRHLALALSIQSHGSKKGKGLQS